MLRLNIVLAGVVSLFIYGCTSFFGNSYEEDHENDWKIMREIIAANPVLSSAIDSGHYFLPTDAEYSRITGYLDLSGLDLNDSNFHFPKSIRNFRRVNVLGLADNNFIELPDGTRNKNWQRIDVWKNKICNPSTETVTYLDEKTKGSLGGYWRNSQRCSDTIPAASP